MPADDWCVWVTSLASAWRNARPATPTVLRELVPKSLPQTVTTKDLRCSLLAIDAVRWLDEVIVAPRFTFHSNSVFAQCNAAIQGMGIVLLPTFVASGVDGLERMGILAASRP